MGGCVLQWLTIGCIPHKVRIWLSIHPYLWTLWPAILYYTTRLASYMHPSWCISISKSDHSHSPSQFDLLETLVEEQLVALFLLARVYNKGEGEYPGTILQSFMQVVTFVRIFRGFIV